MKSRARQQPATTPAPGRTAVAYVRVSSKEQEQGFSIPAQRQLLTEYAAREGLHVVQEFEDVETAKPAPDIVQVALEKSGADASEAIFIGDTVWDISAANEAGVACVAVQTGGIHEQALRDAGAAAVYETIRELRADLEAKGLA